MKIFDRSPGAIAHTTAAFRVMTTLAVLAASPVVLADGTPFFEEAHDRGILFQCDSINAAGRGMAFADLNDDSFIDLVLTGHIGDGAVGVFRNDGTGYFTDLTSATGIPMVPNASGVSAGDYDADGDLDLFFANWGAANVLMRNDGGFQFTDVTATAGLADTGGGNSGSWADYDGDGWIDLYVGNMTRVDVSNNPNRLYRNMGDGTFQERGFLLGVDDDNWTWQATWIDFDRDGDPDIYVSNDKGEASCSSHNYLYRNDGGEFTDITFESGTEACRDSMGLGIADFDRNGWIDLYCTNTPHGNPMLMNQGDASFIDLSEVCGVASYQTGWGALMFDYDNDMHQELYVCQQLAPNRLYDHNGTWPSVDVAIELGVAVGQSSYCVAAADIDSDGDIDFAVQNKNEFTRLFINREGGNRNWVKLNVVGAWPNTRSVGALVDLESNGVTQVSQVFASHAYKSHNDSTVHFGLGNATTVDSIQLQWPDGESRTLNGYSANQKWDVYHPVHLGDANDDGVVNLEDFSTFQNCQGTVQNRCEQMDFDGDADIDLDDFNAFLLGFSGPLDDCNGNEITDLYEILLSPGLDADGNGVLDECEQPPAADFNMDGVVDIQDLLVVILAWGPCPPGGGICTADLTGDGEVGILDLVQVILSWG